ncbi:hypothetical protein BJ508DRAFT_181330 [Ascobolus immersus RN42]|uniref:Uncharacterized protein n=1 Tax=Ascobolus immersus RN42 TaxID=1160509 RepID=A0A3N4HST9_ASCIM|nr:hypothetical protein BJ508DRAFT_181330 [Ascobolus immersus RN42]
MRWTGCFRLRLNKAAASAALHFNLHSVAIESHPSPSLYSNLSLSSQNDQSKQTRANLFGPDPPPYLLIETRLGMSHTGSKGLASVFGASLITVASDELGSGDQCAGIEVEI